MMIEDLLKMAKGISSDAINYDSRKLGRDEIAGLEISTCYTSDMGYETAILDENGVHPVERYSSRKAASTGHIKWMKWASNLKNKKIKKLGYGSLMEDEMITLRRETRNERAS